MKKWKENKQTVFGGFNGVVTFEGSPRILALGDELRTMISERGWSVTKDTVTEDVTKADFEKAGMAWDDKYRKLNPQRSKIELSYEASKTVTKAEMEAFAAELTAFLDRHAPAMNVWRGHSTNWSVKDFSLGPWRYNGGKAKFGLQLYTL